MRAIRFHGREDVRLEDLPEPEPGPGEVKLQVHANGICGSDLHEFFQGPEVTSLTPHPLTGVSLPVVLGHEFSGTVVSVGAGVEDVAQGSLVAVEPFESCGACGRCRGGRRNLCRLVAFHGYHRDGGGLAEYTVVPRAMVHAVPPGVTPDQAALAEPLAVALRSVTRTRARGGDLVVVQGAGPVGLGALLALRARQVRVVMVDPAPARRRAAAALGAQAVLDPASEDVAAAIADLTGGLGADAAIDAAGVPAALRSAVACTRPDGIVVVVALHHGSVLPVSGGQLVFSEVHLTGSLTYLDEFPEVLRDMAAGVYPLEGWVTTMSVEMLMRDGFAQLRQQQAIKVLVSMRQA